MPKKLAIRTMTTTSMTSSCQPRPSTAASDSPLGTLRPVHREVCRIRHRRPCPRGPARHASAARDVRVGPRGTARICRAEGRLSGWTAS
jgi:hypothetical protein